MTKQKQLSTLKQNGPRLTLILLSIGIVGLCIGAYFFLSFDHHQAKHYESEAAQVESLDEIKQLLGENQLPQRTIDLLERAPHLELYSLFSYPLDLEGLGDEASAVIQRNYPGVTEVPEARFHGYPVMGSTVIQKEGARRELLASLYMGVKNASIPAKCFIPHHGLRATAEDGTTVDLVICFTCHQIEHWDGETKTQILINKGPRAVFDKILVEAGIPVAPTELQ